MIFEESIILHVERKYKRQRPNRDNFLKRKNMESEFWICPLTSRYVVTFTGRNTVAQIIYKRTMQKFTAHNFSRFDFPVTGRRK